MSFFMSNARRNPKEEARYKKEVIKRPGNCGLIDPLTCWPMFFLNFRARLELELDGTVGLSKLEMTRGVVVLR